VHLIENVHELRARKIGFRSLQESLDTTTSGGKLIFHVFGALADYVKCGVMQTRAAFAWV
jgi:DNA invertase Pin-like site-specific DNA recombinase